MLNRFYLPSFTLLALSVFHSLSSSGAGVDEFCSGLSNACLELFCNRSPSVFQVHDQMKTHIEKRALDLKSSLGEIVTRGEFLKARTSLEEVKKILRSAEVLTKDTEFHKKMHNRLDELRSITRRYMQNQKIEWHMDKFEKALLSFDFIRDLALNPKPIEEFKKIEEKLDQAIDNFLSIPTDRFDPSLPYRQVSLTIMLTKGKRTKEVVLEISQLRSDGSNSDMNVFRRYHVVEPMSYWAAFFTSKTVKTKRKRLVLPGVAVSIYEANSIEKPHGMTNLLSAIEEQNGGYMVSTVGIKAMSEFWR